MHQSHRSIKTPHHSVKQRHLLQLLFLQQRLHSLQEPHPPQRSHNSLTHREDHLHQGKPSLDAHSEGVRSTAEVRLAFSQAVHQRNRIEEQKTQAKKGQGHLAETTKEAELKLATAAAVHRQVERSAFLRQSGLHARMRGGHSLQQLLDDVRVQPRQPHAGEQARAALLHGAAVPQPLRFQRDGQLAQPAGVSPQAVLAGVIFNCSLKLFAYKSCQSREILLGELLLLLPLGLLLLLHLLLLLAFLLLVLPPVLAFPQPVPLLELDCGFLSKGGFFLLGGAVVDGQLFLDELDGGVYLCEVIGRQQF